MSMRDLIVILIVAAMPGLALPSAKAEETLRGDALIEEITMQPGIHRRFFTDQVMGGALGRHIVCAGWCHHCPTSGGGDLTMGGDQEAKSAKAESNAVTDAA